MHRTIIQQYIKYCLERTEERISWLLEVEDWPFTLNTHYLSDYKDKFLAYYKGSRENYTQVDLNNSIQSYTYDSSNASQGSYQPTGIAKILAGLAEVGLYGVKPEDLPKLLPSDSMEPALMIMADVRAYFQGTCICWFFFFSKTSLTALWCSVAYKRFADNIPLAIDMELVRGIERGMLKELYSKLGITGEDSTRICRELAQESPQVADKRADLLKKLERLEIASAQLLHLGV